MEMIILVSLFGSSILFMAGVVILYFAYHFLPIEFSPDLINSVTRFFIPVENRVTKRVPLVIETPRHEKFLAYCHNISNSGAFVSLVNSSITPGTILKLKFKLDNGNRSVSCYGHAVRKTDQGTGVKFDWIFERDQMALDQVVGQELSKQTQHLNHLA